MLMVLGDSASQTANFFKFNPPEKQFEKLFGIDQDMASGFGYRPHTTPKSLELDSRFWNPARLIPGSDDEAYAVSCLQKLCQLVSPVPANSGDVEGELSEARPLRVSVGSAHRRRS